MIKKYKPILTFEVTKNNGDVFHIDSLTYEMNNSLTTFFYAIEEYEDSKNSRRRKIPFASWCDIYEIKLIETSEKEELMTNDYQLIRKFSFVSLDKNKNELETITQELDKLNKSIIKLINNLNNDLFNKKTKHNPFQDNQYSQYNPKNLSHIAKEIGDNKIKDDNINNIIIKTNNEIINKEEVDIPNKELDEKENNEYLNTDINTINENSNQDIYESNPFEESNPFDEEDNEQADNHILLNDLFNLDGQNNNDDSNNEDVFDYIMNSNSNDSDSQEDTDIKKVELFNNSKTNVLNKSSMDKIRENIKQTEYKSSIEEEEENNDLPNIIKNHLNKYLSVISSNNFRINTFTNFIKERNHNLDLNNDDVMLVICKLIMKREVDYTPFFNKEHQSIILKNNDLITLYYKKDAIPHLLKMIKERNEETRFITMLDLIVYLTANNYFR